MAEDKWDLVIEPKSKLLEFHFADIWKYRYLLRLFVKRDFIAQYKQTLLGPIWHVIQPIFTSIIFVFVFRQIAQIPTEGMPPILFYLSGITLWNYFSACLVNTANTFVTNAPIFGKVYFPRLIIPLSVVLSNIVRLGIQSLLLVCFITYYWYAGEVEVSLRLHIFLIPVVVLIMAGIGLGCGILISSLTTKYRDFTVLVAFGVQLLMYATPIIYPISYLQNTSYYSIVKLNPLSGLVEIFRYAIFNRGTFDVNSLIYSFCSMIILLFCGLVLFNRVEKTFMDTV